MRAEIQEIDLHGITRNDAMEILNELKTIAKGEMLLAQKYPTLSKLEKLLRGCFENSVRGVHFVDDRP